MSDSGKPTREAPPVEQLDFFQGSQFPREQKKNLPGFLRASPRMDTAHSSHILFNQLNHKQLRFKERRDRQTGGGESGMSTWGWRDWWWSLKEASLDTHHKPGSAVKHSVGNLD